MLNCSKIKNDVFKVLVLILIIITSSCDLINSEYKKNISSVLQLDANISNISGGDETKQCEEMRKIDLSDCPKDFTVAYVDHIHAWEEAARIDRAYKKFKKEVNLEDIIEESVLNEVFGTGHNVIKNAVDFEEKLKENGRIASENIHTTFNEVERIAASYGATLPK